MSESKKHASRRSNQPEALYSRRRKCDLPRTSDNARCGRDSNSQAVIPAGERNFLVGGPTCPTGVPGPTPAPRAAKGTQSKAPMVKTAIIIQASLIACVSAALSTSDCTIARAGPSSGPIGRFANMSRGMPTNLAVSISPACNLSMNAVPSATFTTARLPTRTRCARRSSA
jgi:hypothetical protein